MKCDTKHWIKTPELRLVMIGLLLWHLWEGRVAEIQHWWPMKSDPRPKIWKFRGWDGILKYTNRTKSEWLIKLDIQRGFTVSHHEFLLIQDVITLKPWTFSIGQGVTVILKSLEAWCFSFVLSRRTQLHGARWKGFTYLRQNRFKLTDSPYTDFMHMFCTF